MSVAAGDVPRLADRKRNTRDFARGDHVSQVEQPLVPSHLVHVFPSFELAGVPIRIATIMNKMGGRYRHTVIALDGCFDSQTRIDPSVDVTFKSIGSSRYGLPGALLQSWRVLRSLDPDLLLTYNWGAV
jgi:hypothetical protein